MAQVKSKDKSVRAKAEDKGVVRTDFVFPADFGLVNASGDSIALSVSQTIVDRRSGTTVVEEILGRTANLDVIANLMAVEGVRESVAEFLLSRKIVPVIVNSIPVNTIRKGEIVLMRERILANLTGAVPAAEVCAVLAEFVVALAFNANVITESVAITKSVYYPASPVTVDAITEDLVAQSAVRLMEGISVKFPNDEKMSKEAFAESFAEALMPVGYSLLTTNDISNFLWDVVKAIRVRLMINDPVGTVGQVDDKWLHHPMVEELSSNYIFVEAARNMEFGSSVVTRNSMFSLDRDAPMVLASLKGSRRFAITKADEYRATYGKITLLSAVGAPCFFYGWRAASMAPVAQNVSAFPDATMPGKALNIVPGSDAASKFVASSLPHGKASSIDYHVNKLAVMRSHLIEGQDPQFKEGMNIGQTFIFGDDGMAFSQELACLMADKVYLIKDDNETLSWVYVVRTKLKNFYQSDLQINLLGDLFYTKNIGLALLVMDDFTPSREMEPRSQLLGDKALFTRVMDMPDTRLQTPNDRISYSVKLGSNTYKGSIKPRDVGMNDLPQSAKFVVPVFNLAVSRAIDAIQNATAELIQTAELSTRGADGEVTPFASDALVAFMRQTRVQSIVDMAREVSKQYRQTIDGLLKIKSLADLTAADAIEARGVLAQTQFMGYADLIALLVIMRTNGMETAFIETALKSESLTPVLLQGGSDRAHISA